MFEFLIAVDPPLIVTHSFSRMMRFKVALSTLKYYRPDFMEWLDEINGDWSLDLNQDLTTGAADVVVSYYSKRDATLHRLRW